MIISSDIKDILVVEDSPIYQDLIEEAITELQLPLRLNFVTNGEEALFFLRQQRNYQDAPSPQLILLDLNIPKISGLELLEIIKNDPKLKVIPVIILTSSSLESDINRSYQLYANCYITKPSEIEQFFSTIHEIINYWFEFARLPFMIPMSN
jgi:two-component system, chemotaxis family, response regulator Rcp1